MVLNAHMRWSNLQGHIQASTQIYANQIWFNNTRGNFIVASYWYNCTFFLILWSRFLLELSYSRNSLHFMETKCSFYCIHKCPTPVPVIQSRSEACVCFVTVHLYNCTYAI